MSADDDSSREYSCAIARGLKCESVRSLDGTDKNEIVPERYRIAVLSQGPSGFSVICYDVRDLYKLIVNDRHARLPGSPCPIDDTTRMHILDRYQLADFSEDPTRTSYERDRALIANEFEVGSAHKVNLGATPFSFAISEEPSLLVDRDFILASMGEDSMLQEYGPETGLFPADLRRVLRRWMANSFFPSGWNFFGPKKASLLFGTDGEAQLWWISEFDESAPLSNALAVFIIDNRGLQVLTTVPSVSRSLLEAISREGRRRDILRDIPWLDSDWSQIRIDFPADFSEEAHDVLQRWYDLFAEPYASAEPRNFELDPNGFEFKGNFGRISGEFFYSDADVEDSDEYLELRRTSGDDIVFPPVTPDEIIEEKRLLYGYPAVLRSWLERSMEE